ncbi:MAG: (d)CMP kinase [Halieaceae bacterium]|jgi:cytidylate kinase
MTSSIPVICVDGPSGAGKGTLSRELAACLGWHLLDSGALYRVLGFACRHRKVPLSDEAQVVAMARQLDVAFLPTGAGVSVFLGGQDVSLPIRTEDGGRDASKVALLPAVREALLHRQRELAVLPGLVADGRDMGTVVFPTSPLKIFLTASAKVRAERRFHQLQGQGQSVSLARLLSDIEERDRRDKSRSVSPLVPAEDAVVVDSSELSPDAVLDTVLQLAADRKLVSETSE